MLREVRETDLLTEKALWQRLKRGDRSGIPMMLPKLHGKAVSHPGIHSPARMEAISPYLDHLDWMDISHLWELCNERGWHVYRKAHLDHRLKANSRVTAYLEEGRTREDLDNMLLQYPYINMREWVESFVSTGVSLDGNSQQLASRPEIPQRTKDCCRCTDQLRPTVSSWASGQREPDSHRRARQDKK